MVYNIFNYFSFKLDIEIQSITGIWGMKKYENKNAKNMLAFYIGLNKIQYESRLRRRRNKRRNKQ